MSASVSDTIFAIRKRLGKTMAQFGELIGSSHSLVSRYESGQVPPSRSMLILLLLLAKGDEKAPLLKALGIEDDAAIQESFKGALNTLLEYERESSRSRNSSAKDAGLREFAKEAAEIVSSGLPLDVSIAELLRRLRMYKANQQIQIHFQNLLTYLNVAMPDPKRSARSKSLRK